MEKTPTLVYHEGRVDHQDQEYIYVRILSQSACSSCHAKGMCSATDMKEKIIEVKRLAEMKFADGDPVLLEMKKSMGQSAVILAYLLPFLLFIATLIISSAYLSEAYSGLLALAVLVPYYLVLYASRRFLSQRFYFSVRPKPLGFTFLCNP